MRIHQRGICLAGWFFCVLTAISALNPEAVMGQEEDKWISEIRLGVLGHDVDNLWSHFREESGIDYNAEVIFGRPSTALFSGTLRPNFGIVINDSGDTSKVYGGLLWEHEFQSGIFLNLGLGAAVHDGELETRERDKKELGSRLLFRIPLEIGYRLRSYLQRLPCRTQ